MARCQWIRDTQLEFGGFWLPGCYKRALDTRAENPKNRDCNCFGADGSESDVNSYELRIEKLERDVRALQARLRSLTPTLTGAPTDE